MSFSSDLKNEICATKSDNILEVKALLNVAFSYFNILSSKKVKMSTENPSVARYLNSLIKQGLNVKSIVKFKKNEQNNGFSIELDDEEIIHSVARSIYLINETTNQVSPNLNIGILSDINLVKAGIKGAFLVGGSITSPDKGYHFEIVTHRLKILEDTAKLFNEFDIYPKTIKRNSNYVLYIKEKETIADVINILGGKQLLFKFHDVIMQKEIRNELNRKQNFEQANLDKTVNASVIQINAIKKIMEQNKFEMLPQNLKEVAIVRLQNPDCSLNELKDMLKEDITRSGINHRLKKIVELSKV